MQEEMLKKLESLRITFQTAASAIIGKIVYPILGEHVALNQKRSVLYGQPKIIPHE